MRLGVSIAACPVLVILFGGCTLLAAPSSESTPRQPASISQSDAGDNGLRGYFPDIELVTAHGEKVRFLSDLVRGRQVLIQFMYTQCDGT